MRDGDLVVLIIVGAALAIGLISMLVGKVVAVYDWLCFWWEAKLEDTRIQMAKEKSSPSVSAYESEVSPVSEFISFPENSAEVAVADTLARLIIAGEIDVTTAVKIGCGKKSGEGYQKWSRLVRAAMERQQEGVTPIAQRSTPAQFASDKVAR